MQQDFDATLSEFLAKTRIYIEQQNGSLAEYEQALVSARDAFELQHQFVEEMLKGLEVLQESPLPPSVESSKSKEEAPRTQKLEIAPKWESIDPKKILIVDGTEINRVLMGHLFKRLPVTLEFAGTGEQALGKVGAHQFDLVLMDLQMKGMSGIEVIKLIRQAQPERSQKTKIIAITPSKIDPEEQGMVMEAGANGYFSKEMPRDVFRESVLNFLISASSPGA